MEFVDFELRCNKPDAERLSRAIAILQACNDEEDDGCLADLCSDDLPDLRFFEDRAPHVMPLDGLDVEERDGTFRFSGDDTHAGHLAEIIQVCCPGSLPFGFVWSDDRGLGGACAIFEDVIEFDTTHSMLKLMLSRGTTCPLDRYQHTT